MQPRMYSKMDFLSEKKLTTKSFKAFLESKEAKSGIDLPMSRVILSEFEELLQISANFYQSALKNIAEKRILETRIEVLESRLSLLEAISKDFHFNIEKEILG